MTTPNHLNGAQSPEDQLVELLPLLAENLAPQMGYRLELSNMLLSDIDIEVDYKRAFANLLGAAIENEATFVYTYNALSDSIDLESIKFKLEDRLQGDEKVLADCIYLQRYRDGFIRSFGLGEETFAEVPIGPIGLPEAPVKSMLEPVGLYTLGGDETFMRTYVGKLSDSERWTIREQQTIPLPSDGTDTQKQMIIVRKRGVTDNPTDEYPLYNDDYEIVFQTIHQPKVDPKLKPIEELTLIVRENNANGRTFSLVETGYDRYEHPLVLGLPETLNLHAELHEPTTDDFTAYVKLLEGFAA